MASASSSSSENGTPSPTLSFQFAPESVRKSSNISDLVIHESKPIDETKIEEITEEEKNGMHSTIMQQDNILWEGLIFYTVQSMRYFKDSKTFVDHVLKTNELSMLQFNFHNKVVNYTPPKKKTGMRASASFGNSKQRSSLHQKSLIHSHGHDENIPNFKPQLKKNESFPRVCAIGERDIMGEFLESFFFNPGFEMLGGQKPDDWNEEPKSKLFTEILVPKDEEDVNTEFLLQFAQELNRLWQILYRVVDKNVAHQPEKYSFIPLKHPGIFVPGGRFREIYYWDSFWIVEGLLTCGMNQSAIDMVENLADLVDRFGFIPNGTRKYYLTRSQPPLLILMANEVYNVTKDKKWLQSILLSLVKEYKYWTTSPIQVSIIRCIGDECDDKQYKFARYYSAEATPRPESYYEDRMTVRLEDDEKTHGDVYKNIRAAAASGWDFSSRWYYDEKGAYGSKAISPRKFVYNLLDQENTVGALIKLMDKSTLVIDDDDDAMSVDEEIFDKFAQQRIQFDKEFSLTKLDTCNVIPVDLNVFLCKAEGYLSKFYTEIGDEENAKKFKQYQDERIESMLELLWDETHNQFRDWNFRYKCYGNLDMASNYSPLWLDCNNKLLNEKKELLFESLCKSGLICGGGIVTTLFETGEQWDYPNCWAPLNSIIIEGLYMMGKIDYALKLANVWINNNYHTWLMSKKMHEKYHCHRYGTGGGGEYKPQFGFGWTNGVCLKMMEMFGPKLILNQS